MQDVICLNVCRCVVLQRLLSFLFNKLVISYIWQLGPTLVKDQGQGIQMFCIHENQTYGFYTSYSFSQATTERQVQVDGISCNSVSFPKWSDMQPVAIVCILHDDVGGPSFVVVRIPRYYEWDTRRQFLFNKGSVFRNIQSVASISSCLYYCPFVIILLLWPLLVSNHTTQLWQRIWSLTIQLFRCPHHRKVSCTGSYFSRSSFWFSHKQNPTGALSTVPPSPPTSPPANGDPPPLRRCSCGAKTSTSIHDMRKIAIYPFCCLNLPVDIFSTDHKKIIYLVSIATKYYEHSQPWKHDTSATKMVLPRLLESLCNKYNRICSCSNTNVRLS